MRPSGIPRGRQRRRIEVLGPQHGRADFGSGIEAPDRYLRTQADQDAGKNMADVFVLALNDGMVAGHYTLSQVSEQLAAFPARTERKLPRYTDVLATVLGRLAVDRRHQGKGHGRLLLADALYRSARNEIASFAVIMDAKDENARRFYERESFLAFPDQPHETASTSGRHR